MHVGSNKQTLGYVMRCRVTLKPTIVDAMVIYTGQMRHDGPVRGGGPKLCAAYLLKLRNVPSVMHVASELKEKLNENDMFM